MNRTTKIILALIIVFVINFITMTSVFYLMQTVFGLLTDTNIFIGGVTLAAIKMLSTIEVEINV